MEGKEEAIFTVEWKGWDIHLIPTQEHKYSIIWMHGLGDSAKGFKDFFTKG